MKPLLTALGIAFVALGAIVVGRAAWVGAPANAPVPALEIGVPEAAALERFSLAIGFRTISHREESGVPRDAEAFAGFHRFLEVPNRIYHGYLLRGMKREALAEGADVSDEERHMIPRIRTILEFDQKVVAPRNGFAARSQGGNGYQAFSSSRTKSRSSGTRARIASRSSPMQTESS